MSSFNYQSLEGLTEDQKAEIMVGVRVAEREEMEVAARKEAERREAAEVRAQLDAADMGDEPWAIRRGSDRCRRTGRKERGEVMTNKPTLEQAEPCSPKSMPTPPMTGPGWTGERRDKDHVRSRAIFGTDSGGWRDGRRRGEGQVVAELVPVGGDITAHGPFVRPCTTSIFDPMPHLGNTGRSVPRRLDQEFHFTLDVCA